MWISNLAATALMIPVNETKVFNNDIIICLRNVCWFLPNSAYSELIRSSTQHWSSWSQESRLSVHPLVCIAHVGWKVSKALFVLDYICVLVYAPIYRTVYHSCYWKNYCMEIIWFSFLQSPLLIISVQRLPSKKHTCKLLSRLFILPIISMAFYLKWIFAETSPIQSMLTPSILIESANPSFWEFAMQLISAAPPRSRGPAPISFWTESWLSKKKPTKRKKKKNALFSYLNKNGSIIYSNALAT